MRFSPDREHGKSKPHRVDFADKDTIIKEIEQSRSWKEGKEILCRLVNRLME